MGVQRWFYVFLSVFLFVSIIFLGTNCDSLKGPKGDKGDPGTGGGTSATWQTATSIFDDNVCIIGIIPSGEDFVVQIGTGWAISPTKILTNAHVAYGIYDVCRDAGYGLNSANDKIVAVKNDTYVGESGTYELKECAVHTEYSNWNVFSNDFAVFTIDTAGFLGNVPIASSGTLQSLYVGQYVGTMGYPGELTGDWPYDAYMPIATFKDGTISALRPYIQLPPEKSSASSFSLSGISSVQASTDRPVIQYNFNTTGGTSGSPVFLQSGEVIAINNSGWPLIVEDYYGDIIRITVGDLCWGIRIDQRTNIETAMPHQVNVSDFRDPDPSEYSSLSAGQYRITFDWDSWYDFDLYLQIGKNSYIVGGYNDPSRAHIYPFVVHHGDSWGYGPEKATVLQLIENVKIFAYKYSYGGSFSSSMTTCQITSSSGVIAEVNNPPYGYDYFWLIGTLNSNGTFTETNELSNEDPLLQASNIVRDHLKAFGVDIAQCEKEVIKKRK